VGIVFEVIDRAGRGVHLSMERWGEHIKLEHPDIENPEEIRQTILNPDKIIKQDGFIYNYYKFFKHKKLKLKYLKVIVNYLNDIGFVVTAHFVASIRIR